MYQYMEHTTQNYCNIHIIHTPYNAGVAEIFISNNKSAQDQTGTGKT